VPAMDRYPDMSNMDMPDRTYQLVLNLDSGSADTVLMGPRVDGELAGIGAEGMNRSRRRANSSSSAELQSLREKVSLLSMQKDYWWQRYTESADECKAAQNEVLELRKVLAESRSGVAGGDNDHPRPAYVDRRLFS